MTHPDDDILAEFHAGLISGRRGDRIAGHLTSCERCTAFGAQLADVSALLAAVPAPAMPPELALRLDTVLAAEVAEKEKINYAERTGADGPREPHTRHRRSGNWGFRLVSLRVLAPAAAVVLAGAGYGLSLLSSSPATQSAASSSAASPSLGRVHTPVKAAPAVPGVSSQGPRAKPAVMTPHSFSVRISPTDYQRGTLRHQLQTELHSPAPARSTRTPSSQLVACVRLVTSNITPVFVESAHFGGQPATIVVVSRGSAGKQAWVVGSGCTGSDKDLLDQTTLPPGI